jgi:hypothetical protein
MPTIWWWVSKAGRRIAAAALQNEARIGSRGFLIGPIENVLASDIGIALVSAVRAMGLHRFVLRIWHC